MALVRPNYGRVYTQNELRVQAARKRFHEAAAQVVAAALAVAVVALAVGAYRAHQGAPGRLQ